MNGFLLSRGTKYYFMPSTNCKKTRKLIQTFIFRLGKAINARESNISACMNDDKCIKQFSYNIDNATLEHCTTDNGFKYVKIYGKNFSIAMPLSDYETDVILLDTVNTFAKI